jgi:hypothetical protein
LSNQRASIISENDEEKDNKQKKSVVARSITDHNLLAIADEEANKADKTDKKAKLDRRVE